MRFPIVLHKCLHFCETLIEHIFVYAINIMYNKYINKSNNGYLLVIGGGEPFKKFKQITKIVEKVKTDREIHILLCSGKGRVNSSISCSSKISFMRKLI